MIQLLQVKQTIMQNNYPDNTLFYYEQQISILFLLENFLFLSYFTFHTFYSSLVKDCRLAIESSF